MVVNICREVNVYLHQVQPMKNGFVGDPSSEEFRNADTFCVELSPSRAIVTEPVNVAVTPGIVIRLYTNKIALKFT